MSQYANKTAMDSGSRQPTTKDRSTEKNASPGVLGIGNGATANLLRGAAGGKELPTDLRNRMEQSFGIDLTSIRVHDDSSAGSAAESLNAEAFVRGGLIHWGPSAPALDSKEAAPLLAHEVSHVVQQRQASAIESRVSAPGEASEVQADAMAGQVLAGQRASSGSPGAVAATQRQAKASKAEAEKALTAFLQKVANTQPPQDIRRAQVVKDALNRLKSSGGATANLGIEVDKFMASEPNDPAKMAHDFVAKLTAVSKEAIDSINRMQTIDPQAPLTSRVSDLVEKSTAGGQDIPKPPGYVSPEDRAQDIRDKLNAIRGTQDPTTYGPVPVDVLQAGRIVRGLPGALKPTQTKAAPPAARSYSEVEAAIAKIARNALVPAEEKGKGSDNSWADAQEFARDLARKLDVAQRRKQETITINLGDNYASVRDRGALRNAVEEIVAKIRKALPHHASDVINADITTGSRWLTRGRAKAETE